MESVTPVRKSQRKRQRTKYSLDAFEGLDILSDESQILDAGQKDDEDEDEEFAFNEAFLEAGTPEPDDLSVGEGSEGGEGSSIRSLDDDESLGGSIGGSSPEFPGSRKRDGHYTRAPIDYHGPAIDPTSFKVQGNHDHAHTRGVPESSRFASKWDIYRYMLGTGTEDLASFVLARDKWSDEPTLPKKEMNKHGSGGFGYSFSHTEWKREMEATKGWDWYNTKHGGKGFAENQRTRTILPEEGAKYMPKPNGLDSNVLMGPNGRQKVHKMQTGGTLSISEVWNQENAHDQSSISSTRTRKGRREGWMLNVGATVKCLGWAPNQPEDTQYLAISTSLMATENGTQTQTAPQEPNIAPAYAPSPLSPACIQIWAFRASTAPGREGWMDLSCTPELRYVICTEWGPVKHFSWCPVPRNLRVTGNHGMVDLGLLGGIWGDGKVRVLDVQCPGIWGAPTLYCHYTQACFESIPPETICTSIHWLSSFDIGAGCANGFVALWNISEIPPPEPNPIASDIVPPAQRHPYPRPWFYQLIHTTYILALTTAYPSHPHFLITSSMDGYLRLTDLRAPDVDYVLSVRSRIGADSIVWCDPMQCVLASEENNFVKAFPLRRFFTSIGVARLASPVSSLACGTVHPMLLAGSSDGSVVAVNPIRRILNSKIPHYQQIWFHHDWTRKGEGCSRISEGFKVESPSLTKTTDGDGKSREGGVQATIYEEPARITQVAWNPNLNYGGWAAAGMGSGLIRVEDLAQ
ncbi:MAG: hypothetical protein M1835_006200 [Candelina submexicana]|nr:MAG: hypothetical protein M1835_006200 [Candelina submexicana]